MPRWHRNMASILSSSTSTIEIPESARDLAILLGEAVVSGTAVAPVGGRTKLRFGNPLGRDTIDISTQKLNRILAYEPDDMTISVEAGATMASVWNTLAERGLTIPIEVPRPELETVGGLIATGLCGPRRLGSGSLRDALIGIRAAYPDGTLGSAGGMVVKNVSGFDLMRMHLGALGTLGIIVSANFKVVPAARGEATITVERETIEQLEADRLTIHSGRIRPISFETRHLGDRWSEAIRIEGRPSTVDHLARELAESLGDASSMSLDESRVFWTAYVREETLPVDGDRVVLQLRGKPSAVYSTVRTALAAFGETIEDIRIAAGLGTIRIVLTGNSDDPVDIISTIEQLRASGLDVLLLSVPPALGQRIDTFGFSESTLELMRLLKRQFDPWSVLNPGRVIPEF